MCRNEPSIEVLKAIRCQDIQTGLQGYSVGEFDVLLRIGMAARLAIHFRLPSPPFGQLLCGTG